MRLAKLSSFSLATALTALCASSAFGATTDPVGAAELTVTGGGNVPLAPAFVHPTSFQGEVASVSLSGSELTVGFSGTPLIASEYDEGSHPQYYAEVLTVGTYEGMYFDIVSNTNNELVLTTWTGSPQPIAVSDSILVRKHMTVGDFFTDASDSLSAFSDSIKLFFEDNASLSLFWDGTMWTRDFAINDNDFPIYPGQGFLALFSTDQTFTVYGNVKTTKTQVPVYNGDINLIGTMSPVDVTFANLDTVSWMAPYSDSFKLFSLDGSLLSLATIFSDGTQMTDFSENKDDEILINHSSFLLLPSADFNWVQPAAYSD